MSPKKKLKAPVRDAQIKSPSRSLPKMFQEVAFKDQMKTLSEIVLKSNKMLHDELKVIQASKQLLGNKSNDIRF